MGVKSSFRVHSQVFVYAVVIFCQSEKQREQRNVQTKRPNNHQNSLQVKQIASCQQAKYNRTISESCSRERGTLSPTFSRLGPKMTFAKILKPLFLIASNKKSRAIKIHEPADPHRLIRAMAKVAISIF